MRGRAIFFCANCNFSLKNISALKKKYYICNVIKNKQEERRSSIITAQRIMKRSEYKEKSVTSQGRKSLHDDLISEIKQRMDSFVDNAPEANKDKARVLFDKALSKMAEMGNSILFDFFVDDQVSDVDFIRHTQQVISNKF